MRAVAQFDLDGATESVCLLPGAKRSTLEARSKEASGMQMDFSLQLVDEKRRRVFQALHPAEQSKRCVHEFYPNALSLARADRLRRLPLICSAERFVFNNKATA